MNITVATYKRRKESDNLEELIKVFKQNDKDLVSARELHEYLGVTERFQQWFDKRVKKYGFIENEDFSCVKTFTHQNQYGGEKQINDYAITLDMAKELCLLQENDLGRQARRYLIERDKKLTAIENDIRKQINNGAIHGVQGKEYKKYPHAYIDELMYKNSILGGKEAFQLANIIYECGVEDGRKGHAI